MLRVLAILLMAVLAVGCEPATPKSQPASSGSTPIPSESPPQNAATAPQSEALLTSSEFPTFWTGFRNTLISGEYSVLATVTAFPLEVRGDSDAEPPVQLQRPQFDDTMRTILNQDSGMRAQEETVREFLQRAPAPGPRDVEPDGRAARVGDFVFERRHDQWRLVRVYLRDEERRP